MLCLTETVVVSLPSLQGGVKCFLSMVRIKMAHWSRLYLKQFGSNVSALGIDNKRNELYLHTVQQADMKKNSVLFKIAKFYEQYDGKIDLETYRTRSGLMT